LEVSELTENKIKISAPLFDNRNHYGSAFGGSIATLGIVAGWAILTYKIKEENIPATLVIKSSNTEYLLSVKDKFYAEVTIEEPKWESLKTKFAEKNKAGMEVTAEIISEGKVCARQKSVYVCLNSK
jgi:thioesterase domain-containing protein